MIFITFNNRNDNFGDQLIFSLLYRELSGIQPIHILNNRPAILKNEPILRLRKALKLAMIAKFSGERVFLLDPPCARLAPRFSKKSFIEIIKMGVINSLWRVVGAEYCVVGISVATDLPKNTFNGYKLIGLRDKNSLKQISRLHRHASYCPDMACLMDVKRKAYRQNGRIIMSFRRDVPEEQLSDSSDKVLASIDELINTETNLIDIDDVSFYAQVNEDIEYNRQLGISLLHRDDLIISDAVEETYYASLFDDCRLVISNRLHVILPAMLEGVAVIALISKSHAKIVNLLTSYGLEDNILYIEDVMGGDYVSLGKWEYQKIMNDNYEKLSVIHNYTKKYLRENFNT